MKTSGRSEAGGGGAGRLRKQPVSRLLSLFPPPFVQTVRSDETTGIFEILRGGELPGAALLFFHV